MATQVVTWGGTYRDARGQTARVGAYYKEDETSAASRGNAILQALSIVPSFDAISNAVRIGGYGLISYVLNPDQFGSQAQFQNAEDKALLTWLCADNTLHRMSIPAPKVAIFLADQETVNLANALIVTLVSEMLTVDPTGGYACNKSGSAFTALVAGLRVRRKFQRKTTIWTLIPAETGPEE